MTGKKITIFAVSLVPIKLYRISKPKFSNSRSMLIRMRERAMKRAAEQHTNVNWNSPRGAVFLGILANRWAGKSAPQMTTLCRVER